jgi:branched-subunit amino acid transport protein
MTIWLLIGGCALATAAIKAFGPIVVGGRDLPDAFSRVIGMMAAPLLAALVVTAALAEGSTLAVGEETAGVAVAGAWFWRGGNIIVGVLLAAAVTAGLRAIA